MSEHPEERMKRKCGHEVDGERCQECVPAEHAHRLIEKFNEVNHRIDKKNVNCETIADPFAGGSGILEHAKTFFKKSLVGHLADAFKEFEFVAVDHANIRKSIKLDMRSLDIYQGNDANSAVAPLRITHARHQARVVGW
ncbi:hypothetical protein CYMTET_34786 [Cymbomonas tetramitiformis]|uniref:Uncharacterized protein n=1 Tax=Cymbomonas tetramitiformis TaxID=36881 RepID=A0AAE0FAG2_9CHLO|nr:hypothetical protein CYMTET_34786 [Cymbomonas tetramitiformis]